MQRQDLIHDILASQLTSEERRHVLMVVGVTPAEEMADAPDQQLDSTRGGKGLKAAPDSGREDMNETRSELLDALKKLGEIRPEWRLGQTLANVAMMAGRLDEGGVWDLEDDEALKAALDIIAQHSKTQLPESETANTR